MTEYFDCSAFEGPHAVYEVYKYNCASHSDVPISRLYKEKAAAIGFAMRIALMEGEYQWCKKCQEWQVVYARKVVKALRVSARRIQSSQR